MKLPSKYFLIVLFIGLTGCVSSPALITDDFPSRILMTPRDLPQNWRREGVYVEEIPDGESRMVVFNAEGYETHLYLVASHTLSVYPTEDLASNAYKKLENQYFPTDDRKVPEIGVEFKPSGLSRLGCLKLSMNGEAFLSCGYLQLNNKLVSLVLANIDGENLTIDQFVNALKILDIRMQQYEK